MRRIKQQLEVMPLGDFGQGLHVTRPAPHVYTDDTSGARRDHSFHLAWIYIVSTWVNITKDGRNLLPLERMSRSDEGKGRHDDLPSEAGRPDGNL